MNMENMEEGVMPFDIRNEREDEIGLESLDYLKVFDEPIESSHILDKLHMFPGYRLLTLPEIYSIYFKNRNLFKDHKSYWVNEHEAAGRDSLCHFYAHSSHPMWFFPNENKSREKYLILIERGTQIDTQGVDVPHFGL